ncbi:MAG TPA: SUMF1/EgtB/PvdO family nonheme iron enzyme, partial [Isosphaeraceae bacterium]|nr:SUMF1/EgtB/PvdO family nonheme iron enzyme [Isosphaeraceae bacterium]
DDGNPELTGAHDIIGTPSYMSPEQIQGGMERDGEEQGIDGRSDLYSTGVMLYQLLTGTLPFRGNKMAMMAAHLHNKPLPMKEANPQAAVPPAVERLVMQCLEKEPDKRPQTARELADKFRQAAGITAGPGAAQLSRSLPWVKVAAAIVVLGLAAIALVPVVGMFRKPPAGSEKARSSNETGPVVNAEPAPAANPPAPSPSKAWMPEGFAAPLPKAVDDASGLPIQLKRDDGALFAYYRDGMYLPVGYKPEGSEITPRQWPKVIVRQSDKTRFIRIDGGTFLRGDPRRDQSPATDVPGNPLTPHHVRVRGFYIQETEVTNGEIQRYLDAHPDDQKNLRNWRALYEALRKDNEINDEKMSHYPAVCIGYSQAIKYAATVGGRLPTESQWEYAAKSRKDDYHFAWGKDFPPAGDRMGNLDNPQAIATPVEAFLKDKTEQGVYDMTGNVRELCADAYKPYDDLKLSANSADHPLIDQRETLLLDSSEKGQIKVVVRGGSYMGTARKAMTFMRDKLSIDDDVPSDVGFRVVIECPSQVDDSSDQP